MSNATCDDPTDLPTSVLGTGAMGSAVAATLLAHGHPTTVWNRTPERTAELARQGAGRTDTAVDAVRAGRLVVLALLDNAAVLEVQAAIADQVADRTILNLTSLNPSQARDAAAWAEAHGARYVSATVLSDPQAIGDAAFLLVSGRRHVVEDVEPTVRRLGSRSRWFGDDPGLAAAYFSALVSLSYEAYIGVLHAIATVRAEGGSASTVVDLAGDMLAQSRPLFDAWAEDAVAREYPPLLGPLPTHAALMDGLIEARTANGIDGEQLRYVHSLMERAIAEGHRDHGISSLLEVIGTG